MLEEVALCLVFATSAALPAEVVKRLVFTTSAASFAEVVKRPVFTTSATAVVKVLKSELRVDEARATEGKRILQSVPLDSPEPQGKTRLMPPSKSGSR